MKTFKTKFDTLFWNRHLITLEAYQEKVVHLDIHRRRCVLFSEIRTHYAGDLARNRIIRADNRGSSKPSADVRSASSQLNYERPLWGKN